MVDILVCDDDTVALEMIETALSGLSNTRLHVYDDPYEALDYASDHNIDYAFLDIVMPAMNGIELAKKLRNGSFTGEIVFLTSSNEYAAESYAVDAVDYILKPVEQDTVLKAYEKLVDKHPRNEAYINVVKKRIIIKIMLSDIMYVEAYARHVHFAMSNNEVITVSSSLKEYRDTILADDRFAMPHSSYIVNLDYVKTIVGQEIILRNAKTLPISRRKTSFKKEYLKSITRGDRSDR